MKGCPRKIRESARWCEHAHRLLQEYTRPGATEAEASLRAGHAFATYGPFVRATVEGHPRLM